MESQKLLVLLVILLTTMTTSSVIASSAVDELLQFRGQLTPSELAQLQRGPVSVPPLLSSLPRLQMQGPRHTCDEHLGICLVEGSVNRDCCQKTSVNCDTDISNCGECGIICGLNKFCCNGECVNLQTDKGNCGWCGNKCKADDECSRGMCQINP